MLRGWAGSQLRIDLSTRQIEKESLCPDDLQSWIGGRGLNVNIFSNGTGPGLDPFHPETPFSLAVGPLTGSCAPCAAITCVTSRSPLLEPHTYANVSMGGHWGPELKFAGYDQLVITGKGDEPTYIWIEDDDVELREATHLWGKNIAQTTVLIQEELGDRRIQVLCIGPAGERLVRYATLVNSFCWDSGSLGLGAVMGSKNLKAVAVRGTRAVGVAEPERLAKLSQRLMDAVEKDARTRQLSTEGTLLILRNTYGELLNGQGESGSGHPKNFNSKYYHRNYFFTKEGCFSCPINCGRYTYIKSGPFGGSHFGGLNGESVIALGAGIGNFRWDYILKMVQSCILYGLDPVSTGGTIAWAMNSFEKGLLTENETDNIALHWGDPDGALELINRIAARRGIGEVLAEGALRASKILGRGTERLVPHIKGLKQNSTGPTELGRTPEAVNRIEEVKCAADLSGVCSLPYARFPALSTSDLAEQLTAVSGLPTAEEDLLRISERVIQLERAVAVRDGIGRTEEIARFSS
ncbi:MAG: aldehyde ferredoxin oxidoreductase family protein [bacterium]